MAHHKTQRLAAFFRCELFFMGHGNAVVTAKTVLGLSENYMKKILFLPILATLLIACAAEIGSEKWCNNLKEKPKGDWTANEATDYAKHCLLK
jgi:hypothetical protein